MSDKMLSDAPMGLRPSWLSHINYRSGESNTKDIVMITGPCSNIHACIHYSGESGTEDIDDNVVDLITSGHTYYKS